MRDIVRQYLELKEESHRHFEAKNYREAQIALNVANQYWRQMTDSERRSFG